MRKNNQSVLSPLLDIWKIQYWNSEAVVFVCREIDIDSFRVLNMKKNMLVNIKVDILQF